MKFGPYDMLEFSSWKGLTNRNHLGAIFGAQPQVASNIMVELLAKKYGKTVETFLSRFPTKYFETDDEFTWKVIGSSRRNIPLVEARSLDGNVITSGNAGVGGEPFYLVFAEDWFADGEVIVGEKNETYPFRILANPRMEGSNAVYKVELMGGILTGVPAEELESGKRFSWEYAPVSRSLSRAVGDVRFSTPTAMRNEWSTVRIQHKVGGDMLDRKLAVGLPVTNNNGSRDIVTSWMHYEDFKVEETFSEYKNNLLVFGTSNRNRNGEYLNYDKSGEVIRMGSGLREQCQVANTIYYTEFNLKDIENALLQLSENKLDYDQRKFIMETGSRGAAQFSKAVANLVSGWGVLNIVGSANNPAIIQKTTSPLHNNALSAGFQFVELQFAMGITLSVRVNPMYDDPVRNKVIHPLGGVAESYRYDIYHIGTEDQPNIQLCKIRGKEEYRGYQWGFRNPFTGQYNNQNMSHDEDSATIHRMATLGVMVLDPTRTMHIIPAILAS